MKKKADISYKKPEFRQALIQLSARIQNVSTTELDIQDSRQRYFGRILAYFSSISIAIITIISIFTTFQLIKTETIPDSKKLYKKVNIRITEEVKDGQRWDLNAYLPKEIPFNRGLSVTVSLSKSNENSQFNGRQGVGPRQVIDIADKMS